MHNPDTFYLPCVHLPLKHPQGINLQPEKLDLKFLGHLTPLEYIAFYNGQFTAQEQLQEPFIRADQDDPDNNILEYNN